MILSAQSIRNRARLPLFNPDRLMIEPFNERSVSNGRTFGLSSCGYDVRLAQDIWLFPFWGRLGSIMEYMALPNNLCARVLDKSTNARMFIFVQNTIIEPSWKGNLTIELTRVLPWPVRLRKGTPIAQIIFEQLDEPTEQPYSGRYQNQPSRPVAAIMEPCK